MIARARVAAFETLLAVSSGRADLPSALALARESLDDDRDRALAGEIASGVLRMRAAIDRLIGTFARRDIDRLDPEVVTILRLSCYQLLHLTRVPASAVVDDAVDLTRRVRKRSATGFVNAVLRTLSRQSTGPAAAAAAARSVGSRCRTRVPLRSRCRIPGGWRPVGTIGSGSNAPSSGCSSTTSRRG